MKPKDEMQNCEDNSLFFVRIDSWGKLMRLTFQVRNAVCIVDIIQYVNTK